MADDSIEYCFHRIVRNVNFGQFDWYSVQEYKGRALVLRDINHSIVATLFHKNKIIQLFYLLQ